MVFTPFAFVLPASAASTCQIGYTGPNSNNQCVSMTTYECTVVNDNDVKIINQNDQSAVSGTVVTGGNTQSGGSVSGTVSNTNGTSFNVSITNTGASKTCTAVATVPATPETPVAPTTPTTPGTTVTPVQPQNGNGATVAALPHTSGNVFEPVILAMLGILGFGAAASYAGVRVYRRIKS